MTVTEMGTLRGASPGLCSSQVYVVSTAGQRWTASTKHWEPGALAEEAANDVREGTVTAPGIDLEPSRPRDVLSDFLETSEADDTVRES